MTMRMRICKADTRAYYTVGTTGRVLFARHQDVLSVAFDAKKMRKMCVAPLMALLCMTRYKYIERRKYLTQESLAYPS